MCGIHGENAMAQTLQFICIDGHESMAIVWHTTGIPQKRLFRSFHKPRMWTDKRKWFSAHADWKRFEHGWPNVICTRDNGEKYIGRFPQPNYRVSNERMPMKMEGDNNSKLEPNLIKELPDATKDLLQPGKSFKSSFLCFPSCLWTGSMLGYRLKKKTSAEVAKNSLERNLLA